MIRNYFKTAFRSLLKNRLFSLINIGGLTIGLACSVFIFMYIKYELSFDGFHANESNIFRVNTVQNNSGEINSVATTSPPLAAVLKNDFPEIAAVTRVGRWYANFKSGNTFFEEGRIYAADPTFLSIFSFPLALGSLKGALNDPSDIILTAQSAEKYFGKNWASQKLVGKSLSAKAGESAFVFTVKGVLKPIPGNSSMQFDFLLPFSFLEKFDNAKDQWSFNSYYTFIQTNEQANIKTLSRKIKSEIKRYRPQSSTTLSIQAFTDIYLNSNFAFNSEFLNTGNIKYVKIFAVSGTIVLLLACINFINLSTASSIKRAKEVGLRKTIGGSRIQLIFQFLTEAWLMCTIALISSAFLVKLLFPAFKILYGKQIELGYDTSFFAGVLILYGIIVLLSGFYPAFYLSSFKPGKVLKGLAIENKSTRLREALIITQFALSIVMIIAAIVISKQLNYMQTKDLGFNRSQLMYVRLKSPEAKKNYRLLKNDILQQTDIGGVSATTASMVEVSNQTNGIKWEGMKKEDDFLMTQMTVDENFVQTTGVKILTGRNFSANIISDSASYIINETAAKRMGMSGNVMNRKLEFWGIEGKVIGVAKDFNFQSLTTAIQPMVLRYRPNEWHFNLLIKAKPDKIQSTVKLVEKLYKNYDSEGSFEYGFVDQALNDQYKAQQGTGKIITCFTVLTILISCMGLFGLAVYTTQQRTKEIGIRKVLGAGISNITSMLSRDFIKPVVVAIFLASPVAWIFTSNWLEDFAYRIDIDAGVFVYAGILVVSIALVTVSFQAIKAASANPVKSLRTE